jgi:hypothetical protein
MTTILVACRRCGREFTPDQRVIVAGAWRLCPGCRPQPSTEARCERCARILRAGPRTLCLGCATGAPAL